MNFCHGTGKYFHVFPRLIVPSAPPSHNKAYTLRSLAVVWPTAHCGKRPPQRRVSKTLCEMTAKILGGRPARIGYGIFYRNYNILNYQLRGLYVSILQEKCKDWASKT